MALKKGDKFRLRTLGSGSLPMLEMKECSGQSFQIMEPLIMASGAVYKAATSNAVNVVGFAMTSGTADATDNVASGRYVPWTSDVMLEGCIAGASEATLALQSSHLHHGGFLKQATCGSGVWYIDLGSATSNATVRVIALRDATGTVHGRVLVRPTTLGIDPIWKV